MLCEWLENPNPHKLYNEGKYVVVDFETTNLDKGDANNPDNRLVLAAWKCSWENVSMIHYSWGNEYEQQDLLKALAEADFIVAHNAKFECKWLERCGFDTGSKPYWDTMLAEWVLAGNRNWKLNLDACLKRRRLGGKGNTIGLLLSLGVCPSVMPRSMLLKYCLRDVNRTNDLMKHQLGDIMNNAPKLLPVVFTRCLMPPVLAAIEKNGMHLDEERVVREYETTLEDYHKTEEALAELTGGINSRSTKQVSEFVYGTLGFDKPKDARGKVRKTATGNMPVDEATLLSLNPTTDKQKKFMSLKKKFSKLSSALSKNLNLFYGTVLERGSILYAEINQGRTGTHRLSSSGIRVMVEALGKEYSAQFQNLPRVYKNLFSPRDPEWDLWEVDGSQLEFRVGGHLGDDQQVKDDVKNKADIHRYTASQLDAIPEDEVTGKQRTLAKPDTFKPMYGGQSGTPEQMRYYQAFSEKYHSLVSTQEEWCTKVELNKKLEIASGLIFYFPHARTNNYGYLNVRPSVFNYPVQSLATAEIIPIALVFLWHRTRHLDLMLVNTIHDSVIAEVPPYERVEYLQASYKAFTQDVYQYLDTVYDIQFTVPLGIGVKLGKNWTESSLEVDELQELLLTAGLEHGTVDSSGEISIEETIGESD